MCLLFRFSAVRTVGSRQSKKQSRSTRRGLRAMFMVRDILRLDLVVNSVSKPLNRVEKILNLVFVNSINPRVSLFM